jgi:hypothetical protein
MLLELQSLQDLPVKVSTMNHLRKKVLMVPVTVTVMMSAKAWRGNNTELTLATTAAAEANLQGH